MTWELKVKVADQLPLLNNERSRAESLEASEEAVEGPCSQRSLTGALLQQTIFSPATFAHAVVPSDGYALPRAGLMGMDRWWSQPNNSVFSHRSKEAPPTRWLGEL